MKNVQDTLEWLLGRNGEIVIHSFAVEHGCTAFDIGGTGHESAPLLNKQDRNTIAPDAVLIRNQPIWAEYKTKTDVYDPGKGVHQLWEDMGIQGAPWCFYHGIPSHSYNAYKVVDKPEMPVVLWFLTRKTGLLHVAPLFSLTPYPSVIPKTFDIVNFPLTQMTPVAAFHKNNLSRFFDSPRSNDLPNPERRKLLMDWLAPEQLEFASFTDHFLDALEKRRWQRNGRPAQAPPGRPRQPGQGGDDEEAAGRG